MDQLDEQAAQQFAAAQFAAEQQAAQQAAQFAAEQQAQQQAAHQALLQQAAAAQQQAQATTHSALGKLLNKPSEYDGKDRNACHTFLSQVRLYIRGNGHLFTDEDSKVLFAATYLRGKAYAWLEPRLSDNTNPILSDFELFCDELLRNLGDPDRERTMARKLKALRQTGSAATYRTEFDNITQYLTWDDSALRSYFYDGLKDPIKDTLATVIDEPQAFKAYQDFCVKIDNRLFERKQEPKSGHRSDTKHHSSKDDRKEHKPSTPKSYTSTQTTVRTTGPGAMDLDASAARKYKPLTPAEKQHRMDNNLCLYCGKPGHRATDCPAKKKPQGVRIQAVLTGPTGYPAEPKNE